MLPLLQRPRVRLVGQLVAVGVAAALGAIAVVYMPIRQAATTQPVHAADVIIVLGTGSEAGQPKPVYCARLNHAARLLRAGYAPAIIVTEKAPTAEIARDYLIRQGIPAEAIAVENRSTSTHENLAYSGEIMVQRGYRTAIVVTCGTHLFRSLRMARDLGIPAEGAAAPGSRAERTAIKRFRYTWSECRKYLQYLLVRR